MKIKHYCAVLFVAAISFALLSFSSTATTGDIIIVKKGVFTINGKDIGSGWSWPNFKEALGAPDRSYEGYNRVHTYDKKNIVVFEELVDSEPSGKVSEIQIHFSVPQSSNVSPTGTTFSGTMKIDKLVITKDLTATKMLSKLKKWATTDSFTDHAYRMTNNGLYVYFHFNADENSLLKVSIGPDKK